MNSIEKRWTKVVKDMLVGRKIVGVRYMTLDEVDDSGWGGKAVVLELDDGNMIYPSQDDEGNGPGHCSRTMRRHLCCL